MEDEERFLLVTSQEIGENKVVLKRESPLKERILVYYNELCTGCGMCVETCPASCIELNPVGVARIPSHPGIVLDAEKCFLCGICSEVCLFNAIEVLEDGNLIKFIEGTPRYSLTYEINEKKCKVDCKECEIACPTKAIMCYVEEGRTVVVREAKKCIYCTSCKIACPEDAIVVEKIFSGEISIDLEKCQPCGVCIDVCPSNAIIMPEPEFGKETEKIKVFEDRCIYCKACENACPLKAISVVRKSVNYSVSGRNPWTKTHEDAFKKLLG